MALQMAAGEGEWKEGGNDDGDGEWDGEFEAQMVVMGNCPAKRP